MPYILKMKDRVKHVFPLQSSCFFSHPPSSSSFAHSPAINQFPSRSAFEGKAEKKTKDADFPKKDGYIRRKSFRFVAPVIANRELCRAWAKQNLGYHVTSTKGFFEQVRIDKLHKYCVWTKRGNPEPSLKDQSFRTTNRLSTDMSLSFFSSSV